MKPNGRRAWRRFAKQQRRKVNRKNRETGTPWINDADGAFYRHEQRFFEQRPTLPPKPLTTRSIVGMSEGAKKRIRERIFCGDQPPPFALGADSVTKGLRIGERLRPCPGCPECADDPLRIVRALSRRMKIRVEIRRCNSAIIPNKFDYLAMLHRPGPNWNPVCGFGPMRHDAVRALCDVILREGAEEFPIVSCDGSGVLPARRS